MDVENSIVKMLDDMNVVMIRKFKDGVEFRDTYLESWIAFLSKKQVKQLIKELQEMINDN